MYQFSLMGNRDELGRSLSETLRIRDRALMRNKEESYIRELDDQLESLKANIDYVQENIAECQRNIVQIEETKVKFSFLAVLKLFVIPICFCRRDKVRLISNWQFSLTIWKKLVISLPS